MAKKTNRTKEQQEYRDSLAQGLKQLRKGWDTGKNLAETLLEDGKSTIEYLNSQKENESDNLAKNWEWIEMVVNPDSTEDLAENWEWDIEASVMPLALNSEKDIIVPVLYENPHMKSTLQKISTTDLQETADSIISTYDEQWYCIVNFIYFSQIVSQHLFSTAKEKTEKEKEYKKILLKWDYLLPDWIALQVFYYLAATFGAIDTDKKWLPNMNWTDFTPFFLNNLKQKYWSQRINILLYWSTPKVAEKVKENLSLKWYNVIYFQDWFSEFDWDKAETSLDDYQDTINVLLVARSTPKIPLQELWTSRNYQKIQDDKLLVMNVWGLFDFMAWVQKRAPLLFRKLKIERLRRLCSQPKRNYQKVLNTLMILPYIFRYLILKKD